MRVPAAHRSPALLGLSALAWLAGCAAILAAAGDLARGAWYTPESLAAVHLVGLGFLTTAIAGALLHLAPNMSLARPLGGAVPGLLVWAGGSTLAVGLVGGWGAVEAAGGALLTAGTAGLLAAVAALVRGRRGSWPEPLAGLAVASLWLAGTLVLGLLMLAERRTGALGLDRIPAIGAHAAMATLGWVGGTILAMATRLGPMMLVAPVRRVALARAALVAWHAGVGALVLAALLGSRTPAVAGAAALAVAIALFATYLAGAVRGRRRSVPPAVRHVIVGLAALVAGIALLVARPAAEVAGPVGILAILGFGAGVTAGHILVMVPTMLWVIRFGALRRQGTRPPRVAHLAPEALGWAEVAAFALGLAGLAGGVAAGAAGVAVAGAVLLVISAVGVVAAVAIALLRPAPPARPGRALPVRVAEEPRAPGRR